MGLGLQHHVGFLIEGQVSDVLLVELGVNLQESLLLRLLEQVVLHGNEQVVQLGVRLLDYLDELALQVLLLTLDAGRFVTLVALVLLVMLLVVVRVLGLGLGGLLRLHWCRLDDQLRLFGLFSRVLGGDQCESLLLLVVLFRYIEDRRGRLLCQGLLLAKLNGLLDELVEHLSLLLRVQRLLFLENVRAGLRLVAESCVH